jgi:1-acyl-sn-glycerol-3-phosphate acyltransferase
MPPEASRSLLLHKRFLPFFVTQLSSAFNDNFFKNALIIWISSTQASAFGVSPSAMISLCSAVFIAPFFVLSASAGQLADRYEKTLIIRMVKLAEIGIMALAAGSFLLSSLPALLLALLLMGVHSAVLGPVKYSILPDIVSRDALVSANALVEMGTFLAILGGTIGGGILILLAPNGALYTSAAMLVVALFGMGTSFLIPRLPPGPSSVRVALNPFSPTIETLRIVKRTRAIFLSTLGISWFWLFGAAFLSLLPVYAKEVLHAHEHVVTLFLSVFCVGIALGSFLTERISGKNLELGLVPFGSLGMTTFTFDLFLLGDPGFVGTNLSVGEMIDQSGSLRILIDLFGLAMFGGFFTVPLYTLIQERAEPSERARVVAGNNILNALFMVVGSVLLAALLGAGLSVPQIFLVLAFMSLVTATYIYSLLPEFLLRFFAWMLSSTMYRLEVRGHENIPETGPVVLVCNHAAFNDWLILAGSVRRPIRFVMDHRIAQTPVVATLFRQGKTIPIAPEHESKETMESAFAKVAEELRNGEVVCIYPEGKITKTGEMNPFKAGIERILRETPVPVVPMAIHGLWGSIFSRKGGPALKKLPRRFRARLSLVIGTPIAAERANAAMLEQEVRTLMAQAEST